MSKGYGLLEALEEIRDFAVVLKDGVAFYHLELRITTQQGSHVDLNYVGGKCEGEKENADNR